VHAARKTEFQSARIHHQTRFTALQDRQLLTEQARARWMETNWKRKTCGLPAFCFIFKPAGRQSHVTLVLPPPQRAPRPL